jgi:hypothetical protein
MLSSLVSVRLAARRLSSSMYTEFATLQTRSNVRFTGSLRPYPTRCSQRCTPRPRTPPSPSSTTPSSSRSSMACSSVSPRAMETSLRSTKVHMPSLQLFYMRVRWLTRCNSLLGQERQAMVSRLLLGQVRRHVRLHRHAGWWPGEHRHFVHEHACAPRLPFRPIGIQDDILYASLFPIPHDMNRN